MQNLIRFNPQVLTDCVQAAEQFLLQQQNADGCWRDYQLEPGASEAWTTAVVLWSLVCKQPSSIPVTAVRAALHALYALQSNTGWGYNRHTASDADSTAWTCRVMAGLKAQDETSLSILLQQFIHDNGSTQTFLSKERFGSWADHHADVQPMIGISLVRCYANAATQDRSLAALILRLREHCILSAGEELWPSFWWTQDAYAIACNLEFLQTSGGIPVHLKQAAGIWLLQCASPHTAFDAAQLLNIALLTGADAGLTSSLTDHLLQTQLIDGSWPSSEVLLVPRQFEQLLPIDNNSISPAFADVRRLMSTALALISLKTVLSAAKHFSN